MVLPVCEYGVWLAKLVVNQRHDVCKVDLPRILHFPHKTFSQELLL